MAILGQPNNELCVECEEQTISRHGMKVILVGRAARIPLCERHLSELVDSIAAENLLGIE